MEDMAPQSRGADHLLEKLLFAQSWRFDFYQAVRLLEMLHPDRQPVGETADAQKESLRFRSAPDLDFPASDVCAVSQNGSDACPIRMEVSFMGLAGHHGVLPPPYTELIQERVRKKDTALRDFLDMFNHRFISLLYRVRKMTRIAFDGKNAAESHFARYLFCLMGMGTEGLQNRMSVKDRALLFYTGLLNQQPRSMKGLEAMLSHYFSVRIKGKQMCGQWYDLAEDQITKLGLKGQNSRLGHDAVIGKRVWEQQGKFELHIGPMNLEKFLDFLPGKSGHAAIGQLTRFYTGDQFDFDLVLILKKEEVPGMLLSVTKGARLGWTSWVKPSEDVPEWGQVRVRG